MLVDEIELGFEPHRLRNVLRKLKNLSSDTSQVFITTHSPVTTVELTTEDIFITRSNEGEVTLSSIDDSLQGTIRSSPEALFGNTVIICEGKTEIGICRAIDKSYKESEDSFSYLGVNLVNGGGSNSSERALHFKNLGFKTILFIDSDELDSFTPEIQELENENINIVYWSDEVCTEERVIKDLNLENVVEIIELALDINTLNEEQLLQSISSRVNDINLTTTKNILKYSDSKYESDLKDSVAKSIKGKELFKNITKGEELGNYLLRNLDKFEGTDIDIKLKELKSHIYE